MTEARHAAVIGHPIGHSRSPALFARFASASGIALAYDAIDVLPERLAETLAAWRGDANFVGCNVTLPHKERALELADRAEPAARACGAANVLTRVDGVLELPGRPGRQRPTDESPLRGDPDGDIGTEGDLRAGESELAEIGESSQMFQTGIGERTSLEVEHLELPVRADGCRPLRPRVQDDLDAFMRHDVGRRDGG